MTQEEKWTTQADDQAEVAEVLLAGDRAEVVDLLLAQAQWSMTRYLEAWDALDSKASQLFQVVTLATTLLTIAQGFFFQNEEVRGLFPCWSVLGGFVLAVVLYLATVWCLTRAYQARTYDLPLYMDPEHIRTTYLGVSKAKAQELLLAGYVKYSRRNRLVVDEKAKWLQWALCLAATVVTLLMVAMAAGALAVSR